MAKISTSLPPQLPRSRPQDAAGPRPSPTPGEPRKADAKRTPGKADARRAPGKADAGSKQATRAPRQGAAGAPSGKVASQLARSLFSPAPPARRGSTEKTASRSQTERARTSEPTEGLHADAHPLDTEADSTEGRRQGGGGKRGQSGKASTQNTLGSSFAALRRARQNALKKARRKKTGAARAVDSSSLDDDDEEDILLRGSLRSWLQGDDAEESPFGEARREAGLLKEMERQGQPPSRILGQLNGQLGGARGSEYKRLLSTEVRPQMDLLAQRVPQVSTDERRRLAALVSRAAYQVGTTNAATFDKLLSSTVEVEARHLSALTGTVVERAGEFVLALQRAASGVYRSALVDKSRELLEKLAGEAAHLPAGELRQVLVSLCRAAHGLVGTSATSLADAFLSGLLGAGRPEALGTLVQVLGPALVAEPGGMFWALQLTLVLGARGEEQAALALANVLHAVLRESRQRCYPALVGLCPLLTQAGSEARAAPLWRQLESTAPLAAELMPACGAIFALSERLPVALSVEALLALGTLDMVGATEPGHRVLRAALLEQERGEWTFLNALPQVAQALAHPSVIQALADSGLNPAHYTAGGQGYLRHVATQVSRALTGPLIARSQKGEALAARTLLSTALFINAELFGLSADGAGIAVDLFDILRAKPDATREQRFQANLLKIGQRHPSATRAGSVESLYGLVTALAHRELQSASRRSRARQEADDAPRLTSLDVEASQRNLASDRESKRVAAEQARAAAAVAARRGKSTPDKASRPSTPSGRR